MTTEETRFNPGARRLCPDGSCLGLLVNGICNVCGTKGSGGAAAESPAAADGAAMDGAAADGDAAVDELAAAAATGAGDGPAPEAAAAGSVAPTPAGDFDPGRRLCDDGACVGVIGSTGACSVCGKTAG